MSSKEIKEQILSSMYLEGSLVLSVENSTWLKLMQTSQTGSRKRDAHDEGNRDILGLATETRVSKIMAPSVNHVMSEMAFLDYMY